MKNTKKEKQRIQYILKVKLMWLISLAVCWSVVYYYQYGFESKVLNGLILLISTFFLIGLLMSERYYISTGYRLSDKGKDDMIKAYYALHPIEAIYNKFLSIFLIITVIVSILYMIIGFIQK